MVSLFELRPYFIMELQITASLLSGNYIPSLYTSSFSYILFISLVFYMDMFPDGDKWQIKLVG